MEIRFAGPDDAGIIHRFICELAEYEGEPDGVRLTPEVLHRHMAQKHFECLIAEENKIPIGFALFCQNFHTWVGPVMWLDDIYVREQYRGNGCGKALFRKLIQIAQERGYARIDWRVLNWNELAISFYKRLGACKGSTFVCLTL